MLHLGNSGATYLDSDLSDIDEATANRDIESYLSYMQVKWKQDLKYLP